MVNQGVMPVGPPLGGVDTGTQLPNKTTLGKDDFLRLLVTQLTHQDPLNPLDQNQFLSQTAQFSQLEALQNINTALANLTASTASSNVAQAASLLGKTVKAAGSDFAFDGTTPPMLPFMVEGAGTPLQIEIQDPQGTVVKTMNVNPLEPGAYTATWDGKDSAGRALTPGQYYYRVSIPNAAPGSTSVVSAGQGVLTGFEVSGGSVLYRIGTALIRPQDIIDVQ
jgi:flagellar basal-body rod modification protein FlgD